MMTSLKCHSFIGTIYEKNTCSVFAELFEMEHKLYIRVVDEKFEVPTINFTFNCMQQVETIFAGDDIPAILSNFVRWIYGSDGNFFLDTNLSCLCSPSSAHYHVGASISPNCVIPVPLRPEASALMPRGRAWTPITKMASLLVERGSLARPEKRLDQFAIAEHHSDARTHPRAGWVQERPTVNKLSPFQWLSEEEQRGAVLISEPLKGGVLARPTVNKRLPLRLHPSIKNGEELLLNGAGNEESWTRQSKRSPCSRSRILRGGGKELTTIDLMDATQELQPTIKSRMPVLDVTSLFHNNGIQSYLTSDQMDTILEAMCQSSPHVSIIASGCSLITKSDIGDICRRRLAEPGIEFILFAVCYRCHWRILRIDQETISIYDPKHARIPKFILDLTEKIGDQRIRDAAKEDKELPRQSDNHNCGVYCLGMARKWISHTPWTKTRVPHLPSFRMELLQTVLHSHKCLYNGSEVTERTVREHCKKLAEETREESESLEITQMHADSISNTPPPKSMSFRSDSASSNPLLRQDNVCSLSLRFQKAELSFCYPPEAPVTIRVKFANSETTIVPSREKFITASDTNSTPTMSSTEHVGCQTDPQQTEKDSTKSSTRDDRETEKNPGVIAVATEMKPTSRKLTKRRQDSSLELAGAKKPAKSVTYLVQCPRNNNLRTIDMFSDTLKNLRFLAPHASLINMKTVPQYIREKSTFFGVYEISSPTASIEVSSWLNDPDTRKRLEKLPDQHIFEIHEEEDVPIALFLLKLKSEGLYPDFDKNKPVLRSIIQNTSDDKISNALKLFTKSAKKEIARKINEITGLDTKRWR